MMNKFLHIIYIALASVMMASCGASSGSDAQNAAQARAEINAGRYERAADILDASSELIVDSVASPSAVAEMAVMYMIINEHFPEQGHDAKALQLYQRARKINADSVSAMLSKLPTDDARYLYTLINLDASINNPADLSDFREYDDDGNPLENQ